MADPEPKEGWLYLEDIEKHKGRREWTRCWWRLDEGQLSYRMKKDDLEPRASITAAGIEVNSVGKARVGKHAFPAVDWSGSGLPKVNNAIVSFVLCTLLEAKKVNNAMATKI